MSTTTIRLPEELKTRVAELAKRAGMTPHGYILEAITEKTQQETLRGEFDAVADARLATIATTGKTIPWPKLRAQLEKRMTTKTTKRLSPRKASR
jgi:predicted transcriptional regulator